MKYEHIPGCQVKNLVNIYMAQFGYKNTGSFVEIGAFNCYNWSNTYTLALAGWNGLLVEPQEKEFHECSELYNDNPNIILEQCCIGKENGTIQLYLGGSTSTIKTEMIETYNSIEWAKFGGLREDRFVECEMFTLDTLLKKHNQAIGFEVLVIDVEGAELDVLSGFTLEKWQPQMVIIEAHEQSDDERLSAKAHKINEYFEEYKKIYSDHINNIYAREVAK